MNKPQAQEARPRRVARVAISAKIEPKTRRDLIVMADENGMTLSRLIALILKEAVKREASSS